MFPSPHTQAESPLPHLPSSRSSPLHFHRPKVGKVFRSAKWGSCGPHRFRRVPRWQRSQTPPASTGRDPARGRFLRLRTPSSPSISRQQLSQPSPASLQHMRRTSTASPLFFCLDETRRYYMPTTSWAIKKVDSVPTLATPSLGSACKFHCEFSYLTPANTQPTSTAVSTRSRPSPSDTGL